jgi:hypothetical protein
MDMKAAKVRISEGRNVLVAERLQTDEHVKTMPSASSIMATVWKLMRPRVEGVFDSFICAFRSHSCAIRMAAKPNIHVLVRESRISDLTPTRCGPSTEGKRGGPLDSR